MSNTFFILRQKDLEDTYDEGSSVELDDMNVKPGSPLKIPWKIPYFGKPTDLPQDIFDGAELNIVYRTAHLPTPVVLVSKRLFELLEKLAPNLMYSKSVFLVSPQDASELEYVEVSPRKKLEARDADDARPTDVQWGPFAFSVKDAPARIFSLELKSQKLLLVDEDIAAAILKTPLQDVDLSAFNPSPKAGGARPDIAAFGRMLKNKAHPSDHEEVIKSLVKGAKNKKDRRDLLKKLTKRPNKTKQ